MHDKNDALRDKFHNTNTYKAIIPQMKSMVPILRKKPRKNDWELYSCYECTY